ncbi:MAG: FAD-dependent monooxygenase, partial [Actinobacteria bacterium]|nr:FAD-dependent monooxygenase [Actinomycetota bacterium]
MRIAVVGGGPGGLYFSSLVKQVDPTAELTVWERNAPDDTFGFGVVFSEQTLSGIKASDRSAFDDMGRSFAYWDDIDIWLDGEQATVSGNGFAAMSRVDLLRVLQRRALAHGVDVRFETIAPPVKDLMDEYDLVVVCDGINSPIREAYAQEFGTTIDPRLCKYIWLGTDTVYDAFKFFVRNTPWGVIQVHAYPMDANSSTFIVEMHEDVWRAAGFDAVDAASLPPGVSDEASISRLAEIFSDELDGGSLIANNSKWISFRTIRNQTLVHRNMALLGDAAHTAHFSIGSGTKLAMEDSLALAACVLEQPDVASALAAYDAERGPVIESTQRSAQASMEWFEQI